MLTEIPLAVAASAFFALTFIFSRLATQEATPVFGGFVASATVTLLYLPWIAASVPMSAFANPHLLWFVGLGVITPSISRTFQFAGVQRIGAAPSGILRGLGPLFSSTLAVLLLGEQLTPVLALGTALIICGIVVLSIKKGEMRSWAITGIAYALGATLIWVMRDLIIRYSSPDVPYKTLAIFVMAGTSSIVMALVLANSKSGRKGFTGKGLFYFILVGIASFSALTSLFFALEEGRIVVVTPITSAQPLFVLLFSRFLPQGMEPLTPLMVLGAAFIVAGGALISLV